MKIPSAWNITSAWQEVLDLFMILWGHLTVITISFHSSVPVWSQDLWLVEMCQSVAIYLHSEVRLDVSQHKLYLILSKILSREGSPCFMHNPVSFMAFPLNLNKPLKWLHSSNTLCRKVWLTAYQTKTTVDFFTALIRMALHVKWVCCSCSWSLIHVLNS